MKVIEERAAAVDAIRRIGVLEEALAEVRGIALEACGYIRGLTDGTPDEERCRDKTNGWIARIGELSPRHLGE